MLTLLEDLFDMNKTFAQKLFFRKICIVIVAFLGDQGLVTLNKIWN